MSVDNFSFRVLIVPFLFIVGFTYPQFIRWVFSLWGVGEINKYIDYPCFFWCNVMFSVLCNRY